MVKRKSRSRKPSKRGSTKIKSTFPFVIGIPSNSKNITYTEKQLSAIRKVEKAFAISRGIKLPFHAMTSCPTGCGHWTGREWDAVVDYVVDDTVPTPPTPTPPPSPVGFRR